MSRPCDTPCETRTRCGVATLGTGTGVELMMPPITPPICPPGTPPGTPPPTPPLDDTGGAIVFVNVSHRRRSQEVQSLQTQLDLTPAEARLVRLLVEGHELAASAGRLGITVETARTRLKGIFQKAGVHSQSQLIRLVLIGTPPAP